MATVLVTGSQGFIGSHIIPELIQAGYTVYGLDTEEGFRRRPAYDKMQPVVADITKPETLPNIECDSLVHLAAMAAPRVAEKNEALTWMINTYGTYNVLKMAKNNGIKRVIHASSAHVFGISPKYMPTDEHAPLSLGDAYTSSKIVGESLCYLFWQNHRISYLNMRMFNAYGGGQATDYFIPAMIKQAKENGQIILQGRHVTKDFVYVKDLAKAYINALESGFVGSVNIGSGKQTSLEEVAKIIAEAYGVRLLFLEGSDGGPTHMHADTTWASLVLKWQATTPLEVGLKETIMSYKT